MEIENIYVSKEMLKCAYFMMSADGKITPSELQKFDTFGKGHSGLFDRLRDSIINECEEEIKRRGIREATISCLPRWSDDDQKRYLLWILVNIAYADGEYAAAEKELVHYAAKEMEMDESLVLEMEDSAETLMALKEKEKFIAERKSRPAAPENNLEKIINALTGKKTFKIDYDALEKNLEKDWQNVINSIHALVLIG